MRVVEAAWLEQTLIEIEYVGVKGITSRCVQIASIVLDRRETLPNVLDLDQKAARQLRFHAIAKACALSRT